ncbi:MAG: hypothetical protein N2C14_24175, partial [Planctomycetales bacterium]
MSRFRPLLAASCLLLLGAVALGADPRENKTTTRFDYHTVRGRRANAVSSGVREGESDLAMQGKSRAQPMRNFGAGWSGDAHLLWDGVVGQAMETSFRVEKPGRYRLSIQLTKAPDYGVFIAKLNGQEIAKNIDLFAPRVELAPLLNLGEVALKEGKQALSFTLTGANAQARKFRGKGYLMGLDYLKLTDLNTRVANPDA